MEVAAVRVWEMEIPKGSFRNGIINFYQIVFTATAVISSRPNWTASIQQRREFPNFRMSVALVGFLIPRHQHAFDAIYS